MLTTILLAATGLAAGITGTWSPCGFSMLSTLGPTGHMGGRRTTFAACTTFAVGALAGGAATFTALSYLGRALGGGGSGLAAVGAVVVAAGAAVGEARGVRVLPQVRRQVPEHWRRVMPMAVAGGLYGVLLGLGFTTFVLTLAVWALAAISVALGDPLVGLAVGLAFGAGRALPVVALAPWIDGPRGVRYAELMAERPGVLRSLRRVDGLLLFSSALALLAGVGPQTAAAVGRRSPVASAAAARPPSVVATAGAARSPVVVATAATDPSASGSTLAWSTPGGVGMSLDTQSAGAGAQPLAGADPSVGGGNLAVDNGPDVTVTAGETTVGQVTIPGVVQLAVSGTWLVGRALDATGRVELYAMPVPALAPVTLIAAEPSGVDVGRPAIDGNRVVVAINAPRNSRIVEFDLAGGGPRVLRSSRELQLLNPSVVGDRLLYVQATYCDQRLILGTTGTRSGDRTLLRIGGVASRDSGHEPGYSTQGSEPSRCPAPQAPRTHVSLWTTALGDLTAYVTELTPHAAGPASATIVEVPLN
ncbi:MAG TPA: hypothetical protein VG165_04720 [Solirubrobacteraceae bacterium]|nr:hypothetical protein [Solirubrobacteraceae bacterium]